MKRQYLLPRDSKRQYRHLHKYIPDNVIQATKEVYTGYNKNKEGKPIPACIWMQVQSYRTKILFKRPAEERALTKSKKDLRQKKHAEVT